MFEARSAYVFCLIFCLKLWELPLEERPDLFYPIQTISATPFLPHSLLVVGFLGRVGASNGQSTSLLAQTLNRTLASNGLEIVWIGRAWRSHAELFLGLG